MAIPLIAGVGAKALPFLLKYSLPLIGGGLGAYEGYKRGGVGGAVLGGGLGAAIPVGGRAAGTALAAKVLPKAAAASWAPAIGSTVGWGLAGSGAGIVGDLANAGALPGGTASGPNVWDMQKPWGGIQGSRTLDRQRIQDQLEALDKFGAQQYKWRTQISKDELMRQLVANRERQNIATGAQLIQQGQVGAQQLGQRGLAGMNQILAQQYQYR